MARNASSRRGRSRGRGHGRGLASRVSNSSHSSRNSTGPMDFFVIRSDSSYLSSSPRIASPLPQTSPLPPTIASTQRSSPPPPQVTVLPSTASSSPLRAYTGNLDYFTPVLPYIPSSPGSWSSTTTVPPPLDQQTPSVELDLSDLPPLPSIELRSSALRDPPLLSRGELGRPSLHRVLSSPTPDANASPLPTSTQPSSHWLGSLYDASPIIREDGFATPSELIKPESSSQSSPEPSPPTTDDSCLRAFRALTTRTAEGRQTAELILRQIKQGLLGCTEAEHRFQDAAHHAHAQENHHPLSATYYGAHTFASSLGIDAQRFPSNQSVARSFAPPAPVLEELFTGRLAPIDEPRNICLHLEQSPSTFPHASSDVDSAIAFPTSLAVIQSEFYYCPTLQYTRKIQTDLHLERTIFYPSADGDERQATLQLRAIPHLYLGAIAGIYDCTLYIFFPQLYSSEQDFESLTHEQMHRFTDYVMLASISKHLPNATMQHIPPGFQASKFNSAAKSTEMRTGVQDTTTRTNPAYVIQSSYLGAIWETVQQQVRKPELALFSDAFLCIMSKGHKLQFQSAESFPVAMQKFYSKIQTMLNFDYLPADDFFLDVATEICPNFDGSEAGRLDDAQVYLFRRCCLEKSLEAFYQDDPVRLKGTNMLYNVKFLAAACNLTSTPPKGSTVFKGGLRYLQCYAVEKEICDAGTVYPFSNPALTELCLDPLVWQGAAASTKWKGKRSRASIADGYTQSKQRVKCAYLDSQAKSFGVRCEYRITGTLFLEILHLCHEQAMCAPAAASILPRWAATPSFVWAVPTPRYTDYVLGNVHKLCATIEAITYTSPKDGIRQAQSYLLYGLLKSLRFFFSRSALHIHPTLWYDRRTQETGDAPTRCGLGFESTLNQTGYGWFAPVVDWGRFQLNDDVYPHFVVNQQEILGLDWKTREARNASWRLNDLLDRLPATVDHPRQQEVILLLLCHLCLQRYRQDVLLLLVKEAMPHADEMHGHIDEDRITFCHSDIVNYFESPWLVSGNRAAVVTPLQMFQIIWTDLPPTNRKHFHDKPYRHMVAKVSQVLKSFPALNANWLPLIQREFFTYHSLLPMPDTNGTLISTAKVTKKRNWWSIVRRANDFAWGKSQFEPHRLPAYPALLSMSKARFDAHLLTLSE